MAVTSNDIFLTDQSVLVSYKRGASGKFLINCLAFNSRCQPQILPVFDNHRRQMGLLNLKLNSFIQSKTKEQWDDLQMGDTEFFNVYGFYYFHLLNRTNREVLVESYRDKLKKQSHLNIIPCINQNKFFFKELHGQDETLFYRRVWPNSKLIIIDNVAEYINLRYNITTADNEYIDYERFDNYHLFNCSSFLKWTDFEKEYIKILDYLGLEPEYMDELKDFHKRYTDFWFEDLTTR